MIERLKWEISTLEERLQTAKADLQDKVKLETNFLLTKGVSGVESRLVMARFLCSCEC